MKFLRYLWFSAACFVAFIYVVAGRKRDNDTRSTIFTAYPGHILKNHIVAVYQVTSEMACGLKCLQHDMCLSYNYQPISVKKRKACELHDANRVTCPSCFVLQPETTYYEFFEGIKAQVSEEMSTINYEPLSYDVVFPSKDKCSYLDQNLPQSVELRKFTLCFWMKTADQDRGTPFSYASSQVLNQLVIQKDLFFVNGYYKSVSFGSYYDGEWHHVCIVWKNKKGSWKFFVDGVITDSGSNFQAGHVIRGGGVVIIAQVQNFAPGDPSGFQYSQSFVGRITGMNFWDFIVPQDEVLRMSQTCSMEVGNVLQWLDFENNYHCNIILENPSSCPNAQH